MGCRAFKGHFIDNKVSIFVYYDESTKIVYRVKTLIANISESIVDQKYNQIKNMLLQKYGMTYSHYGEQTGKESFSILVEGNELNPNMDLTSLPLSVNGFKGNIDLLLPRMKHSLAIRLTITCTLTITMPSTMRSIKIEA